MIHASRLTKRFGDRLAVDALDLDVAPGEVFGLLGPNGAGKTTTVRMLTALIGPTAGTATVAGHPLGAGDDAIRHRVGVLTETPGLYPRLTAAENLRFFGRLHGLADLEPRIHRYLRLLELGDRADDLVGTFSKGMRQKLAIARALLHEPPLLFLDEPTSGLDPAAARKVRDFIASLREDGRTLVLCTHNLDEAERLCDRVAIVRGRLLRVGTPAALRAELAGQRLVLTARQLGPGQRARFTHALGVNNVDIDGARILLTTADPEADAPALVRLAVELEVDVLRLELERASLEEAYLRLVGPDAPPLAPEPAP